MRSLIVGTAGHIDHGKSALVQALTGTDPDRLKEEKERGISIDLGFAHMSLGDGLEASFVDVPGHERFVRHMLAGAHGIDVVMLVVAADESVMPQTREHFEICRLLGIPRGVLVLTKCDAADAESQAVAEAEVRELVAGSFLAEAPLVRVSARARTGLDELVARLAELARGLAPRSGSGLARLPVDRVFTLRGFGTVVTGTLVAGALADGEELELLPSGRRARVRGLQVHGSGAARVEAGHRAAVNLAGIEVAEISRGDVLAHPGTLRAATRLDVRLEALPGARPIEEHARVRVHAGSAEALARLRLLGAPPVAPGASALGQLRLESPLVAVRGDRLVLRAYSPAVTIAGAVVLDPRPPRRGAASRPALEALAAAPDASAAAACLVAAEGEQGADAAELAARLGTTPGDLALRISRAPEVVALGDPPAAWIAVAALEALKQRARAALERFHAAQPLKDAMPREALRQAAFTRAAPAAFESTLALLVQAGEIRATPDAVALVRHAVRLSPDEQAARAALEEAASAADLEGIVPAEVARARGRDARLFERVARVLHESGELRRVGEERLVAAVRLQALVREVRARWPPGSRLDVGAFKEMTGLSRKYVIPLLEYLDRERVTRRSGNDRMVLA
jgi:selenocysteine-specific elongation factor